MRSEEFICPLFDSEVNQVLQESIADEINALVRANVGTPFSEFKSHVVDDFSKKLKTWALTTLAGLQKGVHYNDEKHYVETLKKIINNPTAAANQLISSAISNYPNK